MTETNWIGKTLNGRYAIEGLLGQGGMSAVYRAYDPNLRRPVAIKIIHPHLSANPQFVRRFEEEAASVAQLRHPNLIQVHDFNHDGETYYIVFEYVPGETLQVQLQRLHEKGELMAAERAVGIAAQCAGALAYAHGKGVIHRDIKPSNIIINESGQPIIMDFGIAKLLNGTKLTATGAVIGSIPYMSPEQIEGQDVDARTDIYSLGITLFEMLAGRVPFDSDSAVTLMMMHVKEPIPDLHEIRPELPRKLVEVDRIALAKIPAERYQTATEFADALRDAEKETAVIPDFASTGSIDAEATIIEPLTTGEDEESPAALDGQTVLGLEDNAPASRRNLIVIIAIIAVLLICCCLFFGYVGYLSNQGLI